MSSASGGGGGGSSSPKLCPRLVDYLCIVGARDPGGTAAAGNNGQQQV